MRVLRLSVAVSDVYFDPEFVTGKLGTTGLMWAVECEAVL